MRQKRKFQVGFLQVPRCCEVWSEFGPPERSAGAAAVGLQPQTVVCRAVNACIEAVGVNGLITKQKKSSRRSQVSFLIHFTSSVPFLCPFHVIQLAYFILLTRKKKLSKQK